MNNGVIDKTKNSVKSVIVAWFPAHLLILMKSLARQQAYLAVVAFVAALQEQSPSNDRSSMTASRNEKPGGRRF
ncbi:MAG TPA: hypothetical protein VKZ94_03080, partial [Advenella sp.]|nr:hypothetical protein [Advenella sp.]